MGDRVMEAGGPKGTVEIVEATPAERAIARRAAESRATVPDVEFSTEVDMGASLALTREGLVSIAALLVRACALSLREQPRANAAYRDGRFELYSRVNAGVLVGEEHAFATVLDADRKTAGELTAELDDLERRADVLTSAERSGATFTLARYPVARAGALIVPPHATALVAGELREVPTVRDGTVSSTHVMSLTLACDHRILYGRRAARLLDRIRQLLEDGR